MLFSGRVGGGGGVRGLVPIHCLADFCTDHTDHVYYVKNHRSMVLRRTVL